jgi:O-antigen/teichoic acid export membrane protein
VANPDASLSLPPASPPGSHRRFFAHVGALSLSKAFLAASHILVLPVLARHLSVEDFALAALAMIVPVFANGLSDAGLGRSLIRSPVYTPVEWSSVFWLLLALGAALFAAIAALAPGLAWFFDEPRLVPLVIVLGLLPALLAASSVPAAEVERRERFTAIAAMQVAMTVVGMGVAIVLAVTGFGVWALVGQQLAIAVVRLGWLWGLSRFRPRVEFSARLVRPHLVFGRDTTLAALLLTIHAQAGITAIGRVLGIVPVSLYAMTTRFVRLPSIGLTNQFGRVVFVRMAQRQHDGPGLAHLYRAASYLVATAVMIPVAVLAAAGEAVFTLLLSEKWVGVALLFALAAPGVALDAATAMVGSLQLATGRTGDRLRMIVERLLLWIALIALSVPFGVAAVAGARSVWVVIYLPRLWIYARRCARIGVADFMEPFAVPAVLAIAAALAHVGLTVLTAPGPAAECALAAVVTVTAISISVALTRRRLCDALAAFRTT